MVFAFLLFAGYGVACALFINQVAPVEK